MWYVVQAATGREDAACEAIRQVAQIESAREGLSKLESRKLLETCFVPKFTAMRKSGGEWKPCVNTLFPGYLIVVTDRAGDLASCFRRRLHSVHLVGYNSEAFVPLSEGEVAWIDAFTCKGTHAIDMSTAVSEGDVVEVVEGPLVHREGWLKKINHHRKTAYLEMEAFGRTICAQVGLRVVRKRKD